MYWTYRRPTFFQAWSSDAKEWEQKFWTGFTDQINLSTGVLFAEIWSRKMFSNRIFRNGLLALKTSTACAIPASNMVVLVFSQIFLFAERTTNKIYLLIWICCKGYFNFYNNLPEKKNREQDLNKGGYRYLKCTRPCGFFFHTVIISICLPLFQLKPIYLTKTWKWDGYKFFLAINCLIIH